MIDLSGFDLDVVSSIVDAHEEAIDWPIGDYRVEAHELYQSLFTSAVWHVVVKINGKEVDMSEESTWPHGESFIKLWMEQLIRQRCDDWLRWVGVDVENEYERWASAGDDL
jgi:hypothetical protein